MRRTDPIKLIEVMGRHPAGSLRRPGSAARPGQRATPGVPPERPRSEEDMLAEVEAVYRRLGYCVVVLCDNQPDESGAVLGAGGEALWTDSFGHSYYDSPAQHLARRSASTSGCGPESISRALFSACRSRTSRTAIDRRPSRP